MVVTKRHPSRVIRASTGNSWAPELPGGSYSRVVAWDSPEAWLEALRVAHSTEWFEKERAVRDISWDKLVRVARIEAAAADYSTGRNVLTAHETVAERARVSVTVVKRARRVLQATGFAVTVEVGRRLSRDERAQARAVHGRFQIGLASSRALTLPARVRESLQAGPLPSRGTVPETSLVKNGSPTRADARAKAASRPSRRRKNTTNRIRHARPVVLQKFAWQIADRFGLLTSSIATRGHRHLDVIGYAGRSLVGNRHIGLLCDVLERHGITPQRYTLASLATELEEMARSLRLTPLTGNQTRDKVAYFAHTLRRLASYRTGETLLERRRTEDAARAAARAARLTEERSRREERAKTKAADDAAAQEFFATARRTPRAHRGQGHLADQKIIVTGILGRAPLTAASVDVQRQVGEILTYHRSRVEDGWNLVEATPSHLAWMVPNGDITIVNIDEICLSASPEPAGA